MTNQDDTYSPPASPDNQSTPYPPLPPTTPEKREMGESNSDNSRDEKRTTEELAREFRWVEVADITSNIILAIVGIIALCIYKGQLTAMNGQVQQMVASGKQTDQTLSLLRQQLDNSRNKPLIPTPWQSLLKPKLQQHKLKLLQALPLLMLLKVLLKPPAIRWKLVVDNLGLRSDRTSPHLGFFRTRLWLMETTTSSLAF